MFTNDTILTILSIEAKFNIETIINNVEESRVISGMSGISGSNCIMSGMVEARIEKNLIVSASIEGTKGDYRVKFQGIGAEWNGENLYLSSVRNPYEPRVFKSLDGAVSQLQKLGLSRVDIRVLAV